MFQFSLSERANEERLIEFASKLQELSETIGFKISARGWCYQLEGERVINKNEFDKVESWINRCRKEGKLPVDFTAEEESRQFSGVEYPATESLQEYIKGYLEAPLNCWEWYTPDWWENEDHYIQMLVEKIDLKTLFEPVCKIYKIPIATSKGWSSILQRAQYAKRFKEASDNGKTCVLLYCGDHDPAGLRISDFIMSNLEDIKNITWDNGETGYDPQDLIIERFGLNYDFIQSQKLTWIDNLITGNKDKDMDLNDRSHKHHFMDYVQNYIKNYGARKCEANAIIPKPQAARQLCTNAIEKYLGKGASKRFQQKRNHLKIESQGILDKFDLKAKIEDALKEM